LAAALVAAPAALPSFWTGVLIEVLAFALFATSLQLLMGTGGMVSFGHAAYFGLGAYGAALGLTLGGWPMPLAYLTGPLLAAALAVVFGYLSVRLTSIYFAMLTLAFSQIVYAVAQQWDPVTGGDNGVLGVWPAPWLGASVSVRYYYWALASAAGGILLLRRVTLSPFGLVLRAVRDHPRRAEAVGIHLRAHQLVAFVVAGLFAGLAGAMFAFLKGSVFPVYVEPPMSVEPLVMVLLGGVGSPGGAALGAAVYKLLDTWITRYTDHWQLVLGVVLVLLVTLFPRGILGALTAWRR
jgi:branched-chain amino acid transport system permease protein